MNREIHVRICGGLEVQFLRSTRRVPRGTDKDRRSLICRNSRRDGGGPSKAALQGEALNNPKLLR
jgi:hypothetical protein